MGDSDTKPAAERARNERGQYAETVTAERVLSVFEQVDGPTITSTDVADTLGCSTEAARRKLTALSESGRVDRRKTGRTTIWWRVDSSETPVADHDRERDYLKSFGKYEGTNLAESVETVSERLDRDLRERLGHGRGETRE